MPVLETRLDQSVAILTMNRPDVLNAFDVPTIEAYHAAIHEAGRDPHVRAVVLTGAGNGFCAGGDVKAMRGALEKDPQGLFADLTKHLHAAVTALRRMPKPVVGAINGVAAGGGFGLALACDVRIASTAARFKPSYFRIGVVPDGGMTYFLPRLLGQARANAITFGDMLVEAQQALEWGLVSKVVPSERLLDDAVAYARRLANGPSFALAKAKDLLERTFERGLEEQLDAERADNVASAGTIDFAEGVRSFFEKREAHFTGH